jgi:hypothetical protein
MGNCKSTMNKNFERFFGSQKSLLYIIKKNDFDVLTNIKKNIKGLLGYKKLYDDYIKINNINILIKLNFAFIADVDYYRRENHKHSDNDTRQFQSQYQLIAVEYIVKKHFFNPGCVSEKYSDEGDFDIKFCLFKDTKYIYDELEKYPDLFDSLLNEYINIVGDFFYSKKTHNLFTKIFKNSSLYQIINNLIFHKLISNPKINNFLIIDEKYKSYVDGCIIEIYQLHTGNELETILTDLYVDHTFRIIIYQLLLELLEKKMKQNNLKFINYDRKQYSDMIGIYISTTEILKIIYSLDDIRNNHNNLCFDLYEKKNKLIIINAKIDVFESELINSKDLNKLNSDVELFIDDIGLGIDYVNEAISYLESKK